MTLNGHPHDTGRIHLASRGLRNIGVMILLSLVPLTSASAATLTIDLKRGDVAPRIELKNRQGQTVDTSRMRDRALVILFGQTNHEKTLQACETLAVAFNEADLLGQHFQWMVVLSKTSKVNDFELDFEHLRLSPQVLHDVERQAFGTYGVVALPSLVVVDAEGKVVHAMSGLLPRFEDTARDALHVAAGLMSYEDFETALNAEEPPAPTHEELRAERIIHLAQQLAARDMNTLAIEKYREALELTPDSLTARLGLAEMLFVEGDYAQAAEVFHQVRQLDPESIDATLGLALTLAEGGEDDLAASYRLTCEMLEAHPDSARTHFVTGLLEERLGNMTQAAMQYRIAAELLFQALKQQSTILDRQTP